MQALVASQLTPEQVAELTPLAVLLRIMRASYQAGDMAAAASVAARPHPTPCQAGQHRSARLRQLDTRDPDVVRAELAEVEAMLASVRTVN